MILYFLDRFGTPGKYLGIWTQALNQAGISPLNVRAVSLHAHTKGSLLAKHGTRKAPTWHPDREHEIRSLVDEFIDEHKPRVIVAAAPEVLCITGALPEFATLLRLRGSVYEYRGLPVLVTLPVSAWLNQVSNKELGKANYGESDVDDFTEQESADTADGDDEAEARFWYEPVIVPVGKFMIQCDLAKLSRLHSGRAGEVFDAY